MAENNATEIPFALVDEAGHLTGKPAEGVAEAIAAALKAQPAPEMPKATQEEWESRNNTYLDGLLRAWQEDPLFTQVVSRLEGKQVFTVQNDSYQPHIFWLYLLSGVTAAMNSPSEVMNALAAVSDWLGTDYEAASALMIPALSFSETRGDSDDSSALYDYLVAYHALASAAKLHGIEALRVESDRLTITAGGRVGSVPIQWDA